MTDETPDVSDLSVAVFDDRPRSYIFADGGLTDWAVAFGRTEDERIDERYEPMMNTLWPLPDGFDVPDDVRDRLDNMTVVGVDDGAVRGVYLALTGGGMDMSWSIARTYVNLGLLPPASLGRLPDMADIDYDAESTQRVIAAVRRSNEVMIQRSERNIDELDRLGE